YFYQNSVASQYAINVSGRTPRLNYYFSGGYDHNESELISGVENSRLNLRSSGSFTISPSWDFSVHMAYLQNERRIGNNPGFNSGSALNTYPYADLVDDAGNALPLVRDFRQTFIDTVSSPLDWSYRPYAELSAHDVTNTNRDYLLRTQTTYRLRDNISVDANYQLTYSMGNYLDQRKVASYYTRNLINQFYQPGATNRFAIPKGDIFRTRSSENVSHQGRLQLNYSQLFNNGNEIQILVGWEVKKTDWNSNSNTIYGYTERGSLVNSSLNFDQEYPLYYNPSIKRRISTGHSITNTADRFLSYYINASYSLSDKYFVSASARKDAANLFGVKANQRGVPLWSIGFAWQATREPFLDNRWLSNLKFRVTYGANGNFSRKAAALSTLSYTISNNNNPAATISTPPNSRLRWERTNVFNLGVDFGLWQGRLKGVLEYYSK